MSRRDPSVGPGADQPVARARLDRREAFSISPQRMRRDLIRLCTDPAFSSRWSASPDYHNVTRFIVEELEKAGFQPAGETRDGKQTFFDGFEYEQRFGNPGAVMSQTHNVYGVYPGTEPDPAKRKTILLVAHLDGISEAEIADYGVGPGERFATHQHQGANDNAASVVALLELARLVQRVGGFRHDILIWFPSAEEDGLLGTEAACSKPPLPFDRILGAFALEMIGRNEVEKLDVIGGETQAEIQSNEWYDRVFRVASASGITVKPGQTIERDPEDWCIRSDWEVLRNAGIQVAGLFGGADPGTYHTPDDTWDKINLDKLRTVVRLMAQVLRDVDKDPNPAEKNEPPAADLNPHFSGRIDNP